MYAASRRSAGLCSQIIAFCNEFGATLSESMVLEQVPSSNSPQSFPVEDHPQLCFNLGSLYHFHIVSHQVSVRTSIKRVFNPPRTRKGPKPKPMESRGGHWFSPQVHELARTVSSYWSMTAWGLTSAAHLFLHAIYKL